MKCAHTRLVLGWKARQGSDGGHVLEVGLLRDRCGGASVSEESKRMCCGVLRGERRGEGGASGSEEVESNDRNGSLWKTTPCMYRYISYWYSSDASPAKRLRSLLRSRYATSGFEDGVQGREAEDDEAMDAGDDGDEDKVRVYGSISARESV